MGYLQKIDSQCSCYWIDFVLTRFDRNVGIIHMYTAETCKLQQIC